MTGKYRRDRLMAHRLASERVPNAKQRVLPRPERCAAEMHSCTRTEQEGSWAMWLKAIANPGDRRGGFAMALRPTRGTAQTTPRPRRGSVLDAVRLLVGSWCGAGRRLSLEDRAATRSFSCLSSRRAAAAHRNQWGVAQSAQPAASTPTHPERCAALAEQAWAGARVLATARRMKRSSATRSHGQ
jgi:hypothetical protein